MIIFDVTGRFDNTETANAAAEKIRSRINDIEQIRMRWSTSEDNVHMENNIRYSPLDTTVPPPTASHIRTPSVSPEWGSAFSNMLLPEFSEECVLFVRAKTEKAASAAKSIMLNNRGFDVSVNKNEKS